MKSDQLLRCFVLITLLISILTQAKGQQTVITKGDSVRIETVDGNIFIGEVLLVTDQIVELKTMSIGVISIPVTTIRNVIQLSPGMTLGRGEIPVDYHNSTHLFLAPSGYGLRKGQAYYQNIMVFGNSFSYGITNHFSITGGGEVASLLFGSRFPVLYISPKFSYELTNQFGGSLGGIFFTSPEDEFEGIGLAYASVSIGNRNRNLSVGLAFGFTTYSGFDDDVSTLTIGGMYRLSNKLSLVTDNWILLNNGSSFDGVLSAGIRIHTKGKVSVDIGLARPTDESDDLVAFPFVGVLVPL